jgi:hypothetical protein
MTMRCSSSTTLKVRGVSSCGLSEPNCHFWRGAGQTQGYARFKDADVTAKFAAAMQVNSPRTNAHTRTSVQLCDQGEVVDGASGSFSVLAEGPEWDE